ncbi:MAG TPA: hypothetical protein VNT42_02290, partial [Sphingomonas sp.]|nr:hypothetical protein [Sphingomonas sp.]
MRTVMLVIALALAGCSKEASDGRHLTADMTPNKATSGPDIAPTAVPGVALAYAYAFLLPVENVAKVQEQHATQCEALGVTRCRITGMEYHAERRQIWGTLSFKLAPGDARQFGKQGLNAVTQSGGMLSEAEINSTDAGTMVASADQDTASVTSEQAEIARQLSRPKLSSTERTQLQQRA